MILAEVYASGFWEREIALDNGMRIPPHGEVAVFTLLRESGNWKIATEIHNYVAPFGNAGERLDSRPLMSGLSRKGSFQETSRPAEA